MSEIFLHYGIWWLLSSINEEAGVWSTYSKFLLSHLQANRLQGTQLHQCSSKVFARNFCSLYTNTFHNVKQCHYILSKNTGQHQHHLSLVLSRSCILIIWEKCNEKFSLLKMCQRIANILFLHNLTFPYLFV